MITAILTGNDWKWNSLISVTKGPKNTQVEIVKVFTYQINSVCVYSYV